jgi:hypothetical protein
MDILNVRDTWGKELLTSTPSTTRTDAGTPAETSQYLTWQLTGDTSFLNKVYAAQIETATDRYFINRQGSLWIDRIYFNSGELQRSRLGGVALTRNNDYPGDAVSWSFEVPANEQSVAILVPVGTPDHIKVIAYNLASHPVKATMTGWEVDPGKWTVTQGTQADDLGGPVKDVSTRTETFERSRGIEITFPPRTTTVLELKLSEAGVPYWSRPDLGISSDDVKLDHNRMNVTVHSLGAVDAPIAKVVLRDRTGKVVATANTARLQAPLDLLPKTQTVTLPLPAAADWKGGSVSIEMSGSLPEITLMNNRVQL